MQQFTIKDPFRAVQLLTWAVEPAIEKAKQDILAAPSERQRKYYQTLLISLTKDKEELEQYIGNNQLNQ